MSARPDATVPRLIVGLGNPGPEYRNTRHNVGFMILDRLAARDGVGFKVRTNWSAAILQSGGTIYCKPLTFMNRSGQSVGAIADFFKITFTEVLILLDDMALPLGKLRLRASGSSGGHNGLQSVIDRFGTPDVPRMRFGIGARQGEASGYVLGRFAMDEAATLEHSLVRALDAIDCATSNGLSAAMNIYNKPSDQT